MILNFNQILLNNDIGSFENVEKLFDVLDNKYNDLTYSDLIDFVDYMFNFPKILESKFSKDKIFSFEQKIKPLLSLNIDIFYLSKLTNLISKINGLFSKEFVIEIEKAVLKKINEFPKETFMQVFSASVNLKFEERIIEHFVDILDDLFNFENLKDVFKTSEEQLNLIWISLSILNKENFKFKLKTQNSLVKFLNNFDIWNYDQFIKLYLNHKAIFKSDIHERELTVIKYVQALFLSFLYVSENKNLTHLNNKDNTDNNNLFLQSAHLEEFNKFVEHLKMTDLNNFINQDPASKNDKNLILEFEEEICNFFRKKQNASLLQNFVDELFNPVNLLIEFQKPKLNKMQKLKGIDSKKFGIIILNKFYKNFKEEILTVYENRFKILKEVQKWDLIFIEEESIKQISKNKDIISINENNDDNKDMENCLNMQDLFSKKFGFDFEDETNLNIIIEDIKPEIKIEERITPKYNLAKNYYKK